LLAAGEVTDLPLSGLFFAIGHEPATAFLDGQVRAMLTPCMKLLRACLR
jgi:thioredoxin reductase